jgi:carbonic anhydrase
MNIYKLIEEQKEELKNNLEIRMSNILNTTITISDEQWYKIIQGTMEDIEYNMVSFNKHIDKEHVLEIMKSIIELHILKV